MTYPGLWARVAAQPLPVGENDLTEAIARDTRHSRQTAQRLVTEYRRFLYLVAVNKGILAPSRLVDRAWHLHLADPAAYQAFCQGLFGRQILHIEGRPAPFNDPAYRATLASYRQEFGHKPGSRMWPVPEDEVRRARRMAAALVLGAAGIYAWANGHALLAGASLAGAAVAYVLHVLVTPWPVQMPVGSSSASGCGGGTSGNECHGDASRDGGADGGGDDGGDGGSDGGGCGGCGGD